MSLRSCLLPILMQRTAREQSKPTCETVMVYTPVIERGSRSSCSCMISVWLQAGHNIFSSRFGLNEINFYDTKASDQPRSCLVEH